MTEDADLLRQYVSSGCEHAFEELVRRHLPLVYSAALRQLRGDEALAKDVAQTVFIALARKARGLLGRELLAGWLYSSTRMAALTAIRGERRWRIRETLAIAMQADSDNPSTADDRAELNSVLDEAMAELAVQDRNAVLLRFFQGKELKEVGLALGISEDAARMRVNRSLEKLHSVLTHRGVVLPAATLGSVLLAQAVTAAPAGLTVTIASAAISNATAGSLLASTIAKIAAMTKLKVSIIAIIVMAATVPAVKFLRSRPSKQPLPDPAAGEFQTHMIADVAASTAARPSLASVNLPPTSTNAYRRLLAGGTPLEVPADQLGDYLEKNRRSPTSLLAAFHATGDKAFLNEAMQAYPNDVRVAMSAVLEGDLSAEERHRWIAGFKQLAAENALANYLSAADYLKSGQTAQAMQELVAAAGNPVFQDYWFDACQNAEEAYRAAGYSEVDAKIAATSMRVPEFLQMRELDHNLANLAQTLVQAGNKEQAQAVVQSGLALGQFLTDRNARESLGQYAMGLQIQQQFLGIMDPNSPLGGVGGTVQSQLDEISQRLQVLKDLTQKQNALLPTLADQDLINYADHFKVFGGVQTLNWLVSTYGNQSMQR